MATNYTLPPTPELTPAPPFKPAVLPKIYPWDEYNLAFIMQWLYRQAIKTGFVGTFEDFKLRYGTYVEAIDPQDAQEMIENYSGTYHIVPLMGIDQVLQTKNKVLNQNIIVEAIPENLIPARDPYTGRYRVIPLAYLDQILRTNNKVMEQDVTIEKIPYQTTSNTAGGYTAIIG